VKQEPTVSACIVCRNEADKLGPCLESASWADEIVVLDLESVDGSAELAREHGAEVITHEPVPVVEAVRNLVADAASGEWILALDPDERVSPGLRDELLRLRHRTDVDVVAIPFMNYDLG
jgi:glycosyltransferase involved in cell wall biosynthesis